MALVKVDSSSRKKSKTEDDINTSIGAGTSPNGFKFTDFNAFPQFYCKRILVQNSNGGNPPVTRIEEAVFACQPDEPIYNSNQFRGQPFEQFLQPDTAKVRHSKKSSHSSKNSTHRKSSPKKHGSKHSRLDKQSKQPPVVLFSGSTGVGKSFIVDLIAENFPGGGQKEMLIYPTPAPEAVVTRLVSCEHNLVIIDGLYFKDAPEMASWTKRIQKTAAAHSKPLWLILVFTTEHWTSDVTATSTADFIQEISKFSNKIEEVFTNQEINTKLITFKPMDVQNVKECARKELQDLNLLADESQLNEIVRQLTSTPTLRQKGCKHVKKYFLHATNISGLLKKQ